MIKKTYVYAIRLIYGFFSILGIILLLKKFKNNKFTNWVLSLFYIWDIEGLIYLDCPWWTYSSFNTIDMLLKDKKNITAFEYGSGASTVWLAKRVKQLYSVEHNKEWYGVVKKYISGYSNINYKLIEPDKFISQEYLSSKEQRVSFFNYVHEINNFNNKFDLIVIDGRARNACLKVALKNLKKNGIIIFDNCNRKRYQDDLVKLNNKIEYYHGLTPSLPYPECTAIIYNK